MIGVSWKIYFEISIKRRLLNTIRKAASQNVRNTLLSRFEFLKNEPYFKTAYINGTHDIYEFEKDDLTFVVAVPNEEIENASSVFAGLKGGLLEKLDTWDSRTIQNMLKKQINAHRLPNLFQ